MRIAGLLGVAGATLAGGYYFSGTNDFAVTVHRPMPEVYSTFSGLRTFNDGLQRAGLASVHVNTARPSDHELIYSAGSADSKQTMRIAFTFEAGASPGETIVHAAIDVPPVDMPAPAGKHGRYVLSESKVEKAIQASVADLAADLDAGRSPEHSANKLNMMLDLVAIVSQPGEYQKTLNKVNAMEGRERAGSAGSRRSPWAHDDAPDEAGGSES